MAFFENDNLDKDVSTCPTDKKSWQEPLVEKLDVTVHTQNVLGSSGSDGPFNAS